MSRQFVVGQDVITTRVPSADVVTGMGFTFTVVDGPERGASIHLGASQPSRVLLGKSPACSLILSDPMVSRRHAALELSGLKLALTDLESTNGTFVNEVSIASAFLQGGETIRLGGTSLRVDLQVQTASEAPAQARRFGRLIGESARMRAVFSVCHRLALSNVPVVIEGETGTGKELVAECLHEVSPRASGPFIVFDCAATPRDVTAEALFGRKRPDGSISPVGVFTQAHGGTLLLDEIGDLDLETQGALLRALDRGEVRPLGDDRMWHVDVRTLAATSRDLDKLVEAGKFREDLYFRLAVGRIELPPVRRREKDAALLAETFFRRGGVAAVPADFTERFTGYDWPGNVRELQNAVARAIALGPAASLAAARVPHGIAAIAAAARADVAPDHAGPRDLFTEVLEANLAFPQARQRILDEFERAYVERVLVAHGGNVARAAAASGIARRYFQLIRARQAR